MVVSTLDGKVSALDVQNNGNILWSVDADTRPLLSSSIGNLEVRSIVSILLPERRRKKQV